MRTVDDSVPKWLIVVVALVILAFVAFVGLAFVPNPQHERAAREYSCGLTYAKYTTEWQNCVDDR